MTPKEQRHLVVEAALKTAPSLSPLIRAELYMGLSRLITGVAAKRARDAAFLIREAEAAQLDLPKLIQGERK